MGAARTTGWQKLFHPDPRIGFLSHADTFAQALAEGRLLAPAKTPADMARIVFNDRVDGAVCAFFVVLVMVIVVYGVAVARRALASDHPTAREIGQEAGDVVVA